MRRLIGIPLAGLLLVVAATAVLAASGSQAAASVLSTAADRATSVLSEVLDGLVDDGTIDQSQADAVLDAVDTRIEELRAEKEALREQMSTFLEDGTLTEEELSQLPEDHPLRNLDQFLDDGQLTEDELSQLRGPFGFGPGGRHGGPFGGHHGGPGWFIERFDAEDPTDDSDGSTEDSDDGDSSPDATDSETEEPASS
jgi:hypothetical protein